MVLILMSTYAGASIAPARGIVKGHVVVMEDVLKNFSSAFFNMLGSLGIGNKTCLPSTANICG